MQQFCPLTVISTILKNMDDFPLYGKDIQELEQKLVTFMKFVKKKNFKLNPKNSMCWTRSSFIITVEKVMNEDLIFISPKGKQIKAFEELKKMTRIKMTARYLQGTLMGETGLQ